MHLEHVAKMGAHHLVRAVAAAMCLPLPFCTQAPEVVDAKRVACTLARQAGLPLAPVAEAAGISLRTAQRLAKRSALEDKCRVVLTWLALEERVRNHPRREDDGKSRRR